MAKWAREQAVKERRDRKRQRKADAAAASRIAIVDEGSADGAESSPAPPTAEPPERK